MNDPENDIETIDRYLAGELDPLERRAFEKKLAADEALAAKVAQVRLAIQGIQANAFKDRIKHLHQDYVGENRRRNLSLYVSGIAASLIVLAMASYFLIFRGQTQPEENFYAYFAPYPSPVNVRGAVANAHDQAMVYYQRKDFNQAVEAFSRIPQADRTDVIKFYFGVSLLGNRQPGEALKILEQLQPGSKNYAEAARWYLALSYLSLGNFEKAKPLLMQIKKGNYQFDNARELLSKLPE